MSRFLAVEAFFIHHMLSVIIYSLKSNLKFIMNLHHITQFYKYFTSMSCSFFIIYNIYTVYFLYCVTCCATGMFCGVCYGIYCPHLLDGRVRSMSLSMEYFRVAKVCKIQAFFILFDMLQGCCPKIYCSYKGAICFLHQE